MSHSQPIDPSSPVPLYHQIAEAIRARIESGELAPGEVLEPLRQAAESWKVNLHTVRHAYVALARSGLIESGRGRRGTRVLGSSPAQRSGPAHDRRGFVERIAREAEELHGLGATELAAALHDLDAAPKAEALPRAWVVECSTWQCDCHVGEIRQRYRVDARSWPIDSEGEPPAGTVIATYFHYNDLRRLWPTQLSAVRFVTIQPDPTLTGRLAGVRRVVVAERDAETAEAVTADLLALLDGRGVQIEPRVSDDPLSALVQVDDAPVLFTPRVWADLPQPARNHRRAMELRYVFDRRELDALAVNLGWKPRTTAVA